MSFQNYSIQKSQRLDFQKISIQDADSLSSSSSSAWEKLKRPIKKGAKCKCSEPTLCIKVKKATQTPADQQISYEKEAPFKFKKSKLALKQMNSQDIKLPERQPEDKPDHYSPQRTTEARLELSDSRKRESVTSSKLKIKGSAKKKRESSSKFSVRRDLFRKKASASLSGISSNMSASKQDRSESMSQSLSSASSIQYSDDQDPEAEVLKKMEEFYDDNFEASFLWKTETGKTQRVWNAIYDDKMDKVYLLVATFYMRSDTNTKYSHRGTDIIEKGSRSAQKRRSQSKESLAKTPQTLGIGFDTSSPHNQALKPSWLRFKKTGLLPDLATGSPAGHLYQQITFDLEFQAWGVQELENHRASSMPLVIKKLIANEEVFVTHDTSQKEIPDLIYGLYQDYARVVRTPHHLHLMTIDKCIFTFNTSDKLAEIKKPKENGEPIKELRAFQQALHSKSSGFSHPVIESYFVFGYYQQQFEKKEFDIKSRMSPFGNFGHLNDERSNQTEQMIKQQIGLKVVNYRLLVQDSIGANKPCVAQEQTIQFSDDTVYQYFENERNNEVSSINVQRIGDSSTYVILFPTGLLLQVSTTKFQILAKIQLHLKRDETIKDICYCTDDHGANQCFWLLDSKNQVWKCANDLDPNSCNWSLSKITVLDTFSFKKFFQPATTFHNFLDTSVLTKMQCLRPFSIGSLHSSAYLFSFNATTTKAILIVQPWSVYSLDNPFSQEEEEEPSEKNPVGIQERNRRHRGNENQVSMYLVFKVQPSFIAPLLEQEVREVKKDRSLSLQAQRLKFQILQELQSPSNRNLLSLKQSSYYEFTSFGQFFKMTRDVFKLYYLGKVFKNSEQAKRLKDQFGTGPESFHMFVVQRKRAIETLFTNGRVLSICIIPDSEVKAPLIVSDVSLNFDKSLILVRYRSQRKTFQSVFKCFKLDPTTGNFTKFADPNLSNQMSCSMNTIGVIIEKGYLFKEIKLKVFKPKTDQASIPSIKNGAFSIDIDIPDSFIAKDLFDWRDRSSKIHQSHDGRILLCGKLLFRLSDALDAIQEYGCFIEIENEHSAIEYAFFSLLNKRERKQVMKLVKNQELDALVDLSQPSFPRYASSHFYLTTSFDMNRHVTPILKVIADTQECFEIYQSKFVITETQIIEHFGLGRKSTHSSASNRAIQIDQLWNHDEEIEKLEAGKSIYLSEKSLSRPTMSSNSQSKNGIYLSLLSQSKSTTHVEVLKDQVETAPAQVGVPHMRTHPNDRSFESFEEQNALFQSGVEISTPTNSAGGFKDKLRSLFSKRRRQTSSGVKNHIRTELLYSLVLHTRRENLTPSTVDWVTKDKLVLTLNNQFFQINLKSQDLVTIKNQFSYAIQQLNSDFFLTIVKAKSGPSLQSSSNLVEDFEADLSGAAQQEKTVFRLLEASQVLQRMELASLKKFAILKQLTSSELDLQKLLFFFTPHEELAGANMFARLSHSYASIHPYLEKIDSNFISKMNAQAMSIASRTSAALTNGSRPREEIDTQISTEGEAKPQIGDSEFFQGSKAQIHMYQHDLSGMNAIDYAFQRNAIYCIKSFVETLLVLPYVTQFRNCFDKALLLMINRGMDVKDLVESQLFYPQIWTKHSYFSSNKETLTLAYNQDIESLLKQDPNDIFPEEEDYADDDKSSKHKGKFDIQQLVKEEQFEMQYHYIFMEKIEGEDKLEVSRTLKDCEDIELFEKESVQAIIDYKWQTYGKNFFLLKYYCYLVFLVFYYADLEMLCTNSPKNWVYYLCKAVCTFINFLFFLYELIQMRNDGADYFTDTWNYLELTGNFLYQYGAILHMVSEEVTAWNRIVVSLSVIFTLAKMVYLIRVFRQLNFLVTMLITVVNDIFYFMILFALFLLTFAESFHVLQVDRSVYGRIPATMAYFVSVLRCAMGDFSIIHYTMGFDMQDEGPDGELAYRFSRPQMIFTFIIFVLCSFYIFIIFMNFLIAVIVQSYNKVIQNKEAFDYQQRAAMINEREGYFTSHHLENSYYFPKIIIVRRVKQNSDPDRGDMFKLMMRMRNHFKTTVERQKEYIHQKFQESFQALNNSIKIIEMDFSNFGKHFEKVNKGISALNDLLSERQIRNSRVLSLSRAINGDSNTSESIDFGASQFKPQIPRNRAKIGGSMKKVQTQRHKLQNIQPFNQRRVSSKSLSENQLKSSKSSDLIQIKGEKSLSPREESSCSTPSSPQVNEKPRASNPPRILTSSEESSHPLSSSGDHSSPRKSEQEEEKIASTGLPATAALPTNLQTSSYEMEADRVDIVSPQADSTPETSAFMNPNEKKTSPCSSTPSEVSQLKTYFESRLSEMQSENRELRVLLVQIMETQKQAMQISQGTDSKVDKLNKAVEANSVSAKLSQQNLEKTCTRIKGSLKQMRNAQQAPKIQPESPEPQPEKKSPKPKGKKAKGQMASSPTHKPQALPKKNFQANQEDRITFSRNNFILNTSYNKHDSLKGFMSNVSAQRPSQDKAAATQRFLPFQPPQYNKKLLQHMIQNSSLEKSTFSDASRSGTEGVVHTDTLRQQIRMPLPNIDTLLRNQVKELLSTGSAEASQERQRTGQGPSPYEGNIRPPRAQGSQGPRRAQSRERTRGGHNRPQISSASVKRPMKKKRKIVVEKSESENSISSSDELDNVGLRRRK